MRKARVTLLWLTVPVLGGMMANEPVRVGASQSARARPGAETSRSLPQPERVAPPPSRQTLADLDPETRRGILDAMRFARPVAGTAALAFTHSDEQLHARIGPSGTTVTGRDGAAVEFTRPTLARGDMNVPLSAAPPTGAGTNHIALARAAGEIAVTEWWNTTPVGLEQGFTVHARPGGRGALEIQQTVQSALTARLSADSLGLVLSDAAGVRLQFDRLRAFDRDGFDLPARLELRGDTLAMVVDDARARYPVTIDPTWTQQAYLKASNAGIDDRFGAAVAVSGNTVVVGAYGEDSNATGVNGNQSDNNAAFAGAAYVFVRTGTNWTQQAYLKASNTGSDDSFGWAVAVSGDTVVVGAWGEASNATGVNGDQADNSADASGAAYVFVRTGTTWTQQAYVKASNTDTGDSFGHAVAVSGDTLVATAPGEASNATGVNGNQADNSAPNTGAAYVFVRTGTTWTQQAYVKASNAEANEGFGYFRSAVAVSGDTLIVGASREHSNATGVNGNQADNSAIRSGAAYVFVRTGTTWTQEAYLKASNTGIEDRFGTAVAVSGNTVVVVVGAPAEASSATGVNGNQSDNNAAFAGAAYVFVRTGTNWTQQAYLKASNTGSDDNFGWAVAVSGDTVVVGAYGEASNATGVNGNQADNSAPYAGATYVFGRTGTAWTQQAYLKASNTGGGDGFGLAVAVSGDTVVAGAWFQGDSGATYAFDVVIPGAFGRSGPTDGATGVSTSPTLMWGVSSGATSYEYCVDTINDNACSAWAPAGTNTSAGIGGLNPNTVYYWHVRAANANGVTYADGGPMVFWNFTTQGGLPPGAFAKTAPADGATSQPSNPLLTWGASGGATSYDVCIDTTNDNLCTTSWVGTGTSTSLSLGGLISATRYYWQVRANNGNDTTYADGGPSAWRSFTTAAPLTQQAYLKASNAEGSSAQYPGDVFGYAVAIDGDTLVVGAQFESSNATGVNGDQTNNSSRRAGAAYVFVRTGTTWTQQAYLKASNTEPTTPGGLFAESGVFGFSVAIDRDTIVVGSPGEASNATGVNGDQANNSMTGAGAVYVFVRSGTTWSQQVYLKASNTGGTDQFGQAVAIDGDTVVVGANNEDSNARGVNGNQADNSAEQAGAAYVFVRTGTTWAQQAYLKASNTDGSDGFGWAVAISGNTAVVAALGEDSNATGVNGNEDNESADRSGAAYVFVRTGTTWIQQAYLKASNTGAMDFFGNTVAIDGDTVVVGAVQEDSNATGVNGNQADNSAPEAGAAYVFVRTGTTWTQQAYLKASNTESVDVFSSAVAVSGDTLLVGASFEDGNATGVNGNQADNSAANAGAAYVFVRTGTTWTQQAYLKASNTGSGDQFGFAGALSGDTLVVGAYREASNATGVDGNQADNSAAEAGAAYAFALVPPIAFGKSSPANGATVVSTSPTLSWGANSGATGYEYCVDTSNDNACSSWTTGVGTSVGLGGLATNTTYYWHVRANNAAGTTYSNGSATAFWSFATAPAVDVVHNGGFDTGTSGWSLFAKPDSSYMVSQLNDGVFEFYRVAQPQGELGQATIFQETGTAVAAGAPLLAEFQLGNSSTVRRRMSVLVLDSNFSELAVCSFWLAPGQALSNYQVRTHTINAWANVSIYFYAATAGHDGGYYRLDNVLLRQAPGQQTDRTECVDPAAPAPGGSTGPDLIVNGGFSSPFGPPWGTFGQISGSVNGGVFEFTRLAGTPAGVVLQTTGQAMTANQILSASFQLGNGGNVRKRVTAIIHDNDFSDMAACTFYVEPNAALATRTMRVHTTKAWANATIAFYPAGIPGTTGQEPVHRLDNVTLRRTPDVAVNGTTCLETGAAGLATPEDEPGAPVPIATSPPERTAVDDDAWTAVGFQRLHSGDRGTSSAFVAIAENDELRVLQLNDPVDLTTAAAARLVFESWLAAAPGAVAEVQATVDGERWLTVGVVPETQTRALMRLDLSEFLGRTIRLRFVLRPDGLAAPAAPDLWWIGGIVIERD